MLDLLVTLLGLAGVILGIFLHAFMWFKWPR